MKKTTAHWYGNKFSPETQNIGYSKDPPNAYCAKKNKMSIKRTYKQAVTLLILNENVYAQSL